MTRRPELEDAIRHRAQQLYEQRGCVPGHEVEDWVQAEAEILQESAPDPAYVMVRIHGTTYTGEYDRNHSGGYSPGEFRPGTPIEIRIASEKMFVKRPNGKELETRIVRKQAPL